MLIDIAICQSRRTKTWKNKKMLWVDLVKKLEKTVRTGETYNTYVNSSKEFQSEKKDVGGFVGGYLTGGKRTPVTNILHRQLISLDMDFGTTNAWEDFVLIYGCEAVSYSTHKHAPEAPRLRLLIPLDRPVNIQEYEAIARKIAEDVGMGYFDSTTFQPQRLMFWPSTSEDGEYLYQYQGGGEFLSADEVLGRYVNWGDISAWPMAENEVANITSSAVKQGNPTEKPGLIGAFCRAYNAVEAAAEFLGDIYEPCSDDYQTFIGGTTSAGVRVYGDGDFFYSFHNSDPSHGKLVNAFDLVRIHKFGHLDKDVEGNINKMPSFKEMQTFVSKLDIVKREISLNAFDAFDDFEYVPEDGGEPKSEDADADLIERIKNFKAKLELNKGGVIEPTIDNLVVIMCYDPSLEDKIKLNLFDGNVYLMGSVPWDPKLKHKRLFCDADDSSIRHYIEKVYNIYAANKTFDAVQISANKNSYHPIKDFLNEQVWDGVNRIETLLIDYFSAEDSIYTRTVTKKFLVAAVARVFVPGIKFDTVLTLVGHQGIKKSTFFNILGKEWFSDSFTTVQGKESFEQLQGNWIIEIAELAGFKKQEVEQIKQFISKRTDKFRFAYGRRVTDFLRQCVLVGTTNEDAFLKDYTGNRRFWPVKVYNPVEGKNPVLEDMNVGQIWAEAKVLFDKGETLYLNKEVEKMAKDIQSSHTEAEERVGIVERFLDTKLPSDWNNSGTVTRRLYFKNLEDIAQFGTEERVSVCVAEIWTEIFEMDYSKMTSFNTKYIHQILSQIDGWVKSNSIRSFGPYGRQRAYVKLAENTGGVELKIKEGAV